MPVIASRHRRRSGNGPERREICETGRIDEQKLFVSMSTWRSLTKSTAVLKCIANNVSGVCSYRPAPAAPTRHRLRHGVKAL